VPRFAIAPLGLTMEGSTKFKLKGWKCYSKKLQCVKNNQNTCYARTGVLFLWGRACYKLLGACPFFKIIDAVPKVITSGLCLPWKASREISRFLCEDSNRQKMEKSKSELTRYAIRCNRTALEEGAENRPFNPSEDERFWVGIWFVDGPPGGGAATSGKRTGNPHHNFSPLAVLPTYPPWVRNPFQILCLHNKNHVPLMACRWIESYKFVIKRIGKVIGSKKHCSRIVYVNKSGRPHVLIKPTLIWVAVISVEKHKRQCRKRQSVTAKREKSQTPKVSTSILTLPDLT